MKFKTILASMLVISSLTSCGTKAEETNINNTEVELLSTTAEPVKTEEVFEGYIDWVVLSEIENNSELRQAFDTLTGVTVVYADDGTVQSKTGGIYLNSVDGNATLAQALGDNTLATKVFNNPSAITELQEMSTLAYTDGQDIDGYFATINAYYNLLEDESENEFNGGEYVSREAFMTAVYKSDTLVKEIDQTQAQAFEDKLGTQTAYTGIVSQAYGNSYFNLSDASLNAYTISGDITKAEAVYYVVSRYYGDELKTLQNADIQDSPFNDMVNGGNMAKGNRTQGMANMLGNVASGQVDQDLYKAMYIAAEHGIIQADANGCINWSDTVTKSDTIEMIVDTHLTLQAERVEAERVQAEKAEQARIQAEKQKAAEEQAKKDAAAAQAKADAQAKANQTSKNTTSNTSSSKSSTSSSSSSKNTSSSSSKSNSNSSNSSNSLLTPTTNSDPFGLGGGGSGSSAFSDALPTATGSTAVDPNGLR